jgi:hypothetical protein
MSETLEEAISSELTAKRIQKRIRVDPNSSVDTISAETTSEDGSLKSRRDNKVKSAQEQGKVPKKPKSQKGKANRANPNFKSPRAPMRPPLRKTSPNLKQDLESNMTPLWNVDTSDDTIVETEVTTDEILEDQERTTSTL